jgi:NAD(P)-dependent dehydrogenase (short-subunit alcohol dehydrogenase family)
MSKMFSLEGKVALVTGASRGIGRSIAIGLAEAGADVALASRNEQDLETVAKEIEAFDRSALVIPTDVTDRDQIEAAIEKAESELGTLQILVNNAGGTRFMSPLTNLRPEGWTKMLSLNLDSVFHASQLAAQRMVANGGGSIIQISSVAGIIGAPSLSFYSAAKGAVRLFSQAVAKELATANVRVNSIAPGFIATDLNAPMHDDPKASELIVSTIPMQRWGQPEDIVGAAIFLASDASSYITGTTLVIDGGQSA